MTNILILIFAIAAHFTARSLLDAVRNMRYHQMQVRSLNIPWITYAIQHDRDTQKHVRQLFYRAEMAEKYGGQTNDF
jgi:hypothetical protein